MSRAEGLEKESDLSAVSKQEKKNLNLSIHAKKKKKMIIEGIPEFNEGDEIPPDVLRGHYRNIRKPAKLDIISLRMINDDGTYQDLQPDSEYQKPQAIEKPQEKWSWADDWDREEFLAFSSSQSSPKSSDKPQLNHSEKRSVDRYLPVLHQRETKGK